MAKKDKKDKKENEQSNSGTDTRTVLRWLYIIGGLVAAFAGAFAFQNEILTWVLVLISVLVGLFYSDTEDLTNFGIRYLLLGATYQTLSAVPAVGGFITGFFGGFFIFLGPMALMTLFMWMWKAHLSPMFMPK